MVGDFEHAVMRKVAWRLVPFLGLAYFINALDRFNISIAALTMNVGIIRDYTGSYEVPMMVASLFMLAASICILAAPRTARQLEARLAA